MNVLITGGNGYVAKSLYDGLKDKYNITTITRQNFNLTDYNATCEWFYERYFDVVIHTAIVGGSRLKTEDQTVLDENLIMYKNLLANKFNFNKFISFGSGAEIFQPDTPYGISKKQIADSIKNTENFYNLRIFGVFDENELATRFIKSNLQRYIRKESMMIHTNKIMDFFYMKDLINLVNYYICNDNLAKEINCSYEDKFTLKNIADFINTLDNYKVEINIENKSELQFYYGNSQPFPVNITGVQQGIKNTFEILRDFINLI